MTAQSAEEGLSVYKEHTFDLILVDMMMYNKKVINLDIV